MRKLKFLLGACIFLLAIQGLAAAGPLEITLRIGDESVAKHMQEVSPGVWNYRGSLTSKEGSQASLSITVDTDPSIFFGLTATNFSDEIKQFGFVVPPSAINLTGPTIIKASIAGGITDNNNNGVTIEPVILDKIQWNITDLGKPKQYQWGVGPKDTQGPQPGFGSFSYVGEVLAATAGPLSPVTFGETVAFFLSPGDTAALVGKCSVNAVSVIPLPGAIWLMGSGLLGLLGWRRLKRN